LPLRCSLEWQGWSSGPFPAAWPESLGLATWAKALPALTTTTKTTLILALGATLAALILTLATLQAQTHTPPSPQTGLIFLPLIIPQIAFLPGLQVLALHLGAKGGLLITAAAHIVFVLPYVWLSLAPAFQGWNRHYAVIGATLGASPSRIFWQLRAPMLLAPILTAFAVGMAVSIGQYLPTLMIGGGRVETLTTEAIALSSGGNRRLIGAYALMQTLLPALGFALALALPRLIYANRRAMLAERPTP
jgi:putative thiamine transport system permease protein